MTEYQVFDPAIPTAERASGLIRWLELSYGLRPSSAEQALLAWMLEENARRISLPMLFEREDLPALLNPHRRDRVESYDTEDALAFIVRFSGLDPETAKKIDFSFMRYMAFEGIVDWDAAFETEEDYRTEREVHLDLLQGPLPSLEFDEVSATTLVERDWGITESEVERYAKCERLFLSMLGILDADQEGAGWSPSLATGASAEQPHLAPGLSQPE